MAYEKFSLGKFDGEKAFKILLKLGYTMREAQRLIDRGRLCGENKIFTKNDNVFGEVFLIDYALKPLGLLPIFQTDNFAVFDKPSGVLAHPNGRHCEYSLNDEIWSLFGKNAAVAHRLDRETSGLIVVGKDKISVKNLKKMFENRAVKKSYLALVAGKTDEKFRVDASMDLAKDYDDVKMRMKICENGKVAITDFERICYFDDIDASLLNCYPITGRQHQIRLHLFHMKHKILGEPLYGLQRENIEKILDKKMSESERFKLCGANRLLLHANEISFEFEGLSYNIKSKFDAKNEFYKLAKFKV
ncbi:MAG: RluA family pseudouridine synthase [Campylobacter sp.]|nr:RluA family pseudouridine synthase [Campylobacter sp.]